MAKTLLLFALLAVSALVSLGQVQISDKDDGPLRRFYLNYGAGSTLGWDTLTNLCEAEFRVFCGPDGRVYQLDLGVANLSGSFPRELTELTELQTLSLSANSFSGTLPAGILWKMQKMRRLDLAMNGFTGNVPTQLGFLTRLEVLNLASNHFSGPIPFFFSRLVNLTHLDLSDNELVGTIPPSPIVRRCNSLVGFECRYSLSQNNLEGTIPTELGQLYETQELYLSQNNLVGTIPTELGQLTNLRKFTADSNLLVGTIPTQFSNLGLLTDLEVQNNLLTGNAGVLGYPIGLEKVRIFENTNICAVSGNINCPGNCFELDSPYRECDTNDLCAQTSPCLNGGACTSLFPTEGIVATSCSCPAGFKGQFCEQYECNPPCYNGGRCIAPNTCACVEWGNPGRHFAFSGNRCQTRNRCGPTTEGNATFPSSFPSSYVKGTCTSGYVGTPYRRCNFDLTTTVITPCVVPAKCPAETYFRTNWPESDPGDIRGSCPPGTTGDPYRRCKPGGVWSTYVFQGCKKI